MICLIGSVWDLALSISLTADSYSSDRKNRVGFIWDALKDDLTSGSLLSSCFLYTLVGLVRLCRLLCFWGVRLIYACGSFILKFDIVFEHAVYFAKQPPHFERIFVFYIRIN